MKFVTFVTKTGEQCAGWLDGDRVIDMDVMSSGVLPNTMIDFLQQSERYLPLALRLQHLEPEADAVYPLSEVRLCAPLPKPSSVRDFYAFEQHVKTARAQRGLEMIPEWYEVPAFYFSNSHCIVGPDEPVKRPAKCQWLDYELEIACVIGKKGSNIKADEADDYIFGYCIMNDWSARDIQRHEVKIGLGPAKGKDFATSIGPYLVTKDELKPYCCGDRYRLAMTAAVNGRVLSQGNFHDIYYTFGQMIERASEDAVLHPGDVIGSGTVGTGCILELTEKVHRWLEPGDVVQLEITGLGVLRNAIEGGK
ncbi:fumarylacetoacetate hydrolase family protein [Paenibacillus cremeus]|uniref:Fumarylacetoacetate hydrolase family protein n=1 Tax=Paenibacillus cremeus TaxID=2163881 RepID=A0A559KFR1_9BACL|nr:fumarylacetoacetate hydrolase family protein [Paenibacillus cremeus]TVY10965.1 fumarylacetoacetate hydrolase family protein [Paenibacillus cremeus]